MFEEPVAMRRIRASTYREVPWKNGGGMTREIAYAQESPPLWRLSLATIERDGPFSDFTGYDRTIVPISGDGIELTCNDTPPMRIAPRQPFSFAGEDAVFCRLLGGTTNDVNVMTRRDRYRHRVEVIATMHEPLRRSAGVATLAYILGGPCSGDTFIATGGAALMLDSTQASAVLCVRIDVCERTERNYRR